jgi:hypothetical protein
MTRVRLILIAVLVVVAGAGWAGWLTLGSDGYDQRLVRFDDDRGEANRFVNTGDRDEQLSIGSPDGHAIVVQWRDPDGSGWSAPETVWEDRTNIAVDNTVRLGGQTVGILQTYTPDVHDDSDINDVTVAIVCRAGSCDAERGRGYGGEPQVTPDGSAVYLGQSEQGAHLWTEGEGFRLARWRGHPGFAYGEVSPSEPVLAPDASLRVVSSRPSRGSCTFELFTSAPRTADLTATASATLPIRGRSRSDCGSYLQTYSADWVDVEPYDHRAPGFWFIRDGDTWTMSQEDPSGLQPVDVRRGCCDTGILGFVHWNDLAYGSPDGRSIVVQTHFLGEERWRDPVTLTGVPDGVRCDWVDGTEVGDGAALLMTCGRGYLVAASADLIAWEAAWAPRVRREPEVVDDVLRVGDVRWSPDDGFS